MKPRILLLADWFAPGYRAGGPIRSTVNFAETMREWYDIFVLTRDTDYGLTEAYPGIQPNCWHAHSEGVKVWYFSSLSLNLDKMRKRIQEVDPDFVYVNSMFSLAFTIWPLWMLFRKEFRAKVILSPRGMLKPSALAYKPLKKKVFLGLIRQSGIADKIRFHATNETEATEIRSVFGEKSSIHTIPNLPAFRSGVWESLPKEFGSVRILYIARIHPIKNLRFFLEVLPKVGGKVEFDIFGPIEDDEYWGQCQDLIRQQPDNIRIRYRGELPNTQVSETLGEYHIFVLPTEGENFGHSILEAINAGRPVLISDQTPWRKLESYQSGWDLPLSRPDLFRKALQQAIEMDQKTYDSWSQSAWDFVGRFLDKPEVKKKYQELFS